MLKLQKVIITDTPHDCNRFIGKTGYIQAVYVNEHPEYGRYAFAILLTTPDPTAPGCTYLNNDFELPIPIIPTGEGVWVRDVKPALECR